MLWDETPPCCLTPSFLLALEVQRHVHADLDVVLDAQEVQVHDHGLGGCRCKSLMIAWCSSSADLDLEDMRVEGLMERLLLTSLWLNESAPGLPRLRTRYPALYPGDAGGGSHLSPYRSGLSAQIETIAMSLLHHCCTHAVPAT